ncbi:MAG: hypothetical protein QG657_5860, partial [Acidobacteriota bacterium]|nr:hypothetical protein [Acidobacteriota bacterium]
GIAPGDNYAAPGNEIEEKMAAIWSEVLGIEKNKISVDANFFELGGHSLKATVMISRICKAFDVNISLMDIFRLPTIRALAQNVKKATEMPGEKYAAVEPVEKKEYYSLSSAQKRLYILNQMNPASTGYNITQVKYLDGLDRGKLEEAFRRLIQRHESLRTSFILANEEPVQRIHDEVEFKIERLGGDATLSQWSSDIIINFIRPFDLSKAPLLRVGILWYREGKCLLIIDLHHIISDGVSGQVLASEFMKIYNGEELSPLRIQYKDFSHWQNSSAIREYIKQQEAYWVKEFEVEIPVVDLPYDYPRPAIQSFEGGRARFMLSIEEIHGLEQIASTHGATLFMILLAMYNIFLARLSNREDIVVGIPIAGRRHADLEAVVGMFINTLAMRNYPSGERTFADFLDNVKERALAAFENQDFQFEDLVEKVAVVRDMGRNPLFDVLFVLQNFVDSTVAATENETKSESLEIKEWEFDLKSSKFDLTLEAIEQRGQLYFNFEYCTRLFKEETILRFINYFKAIVSSVLSGPAKKIAEIEILPEEERRKLLIDFNDTSVAYPVDETVPELFAAQVEKTPDYIAVFGSGRTLSRTNMGSHVGAESNSAPSFRHINISYRQLKEQYDGLAHLLIEKGVLADNIIGIMLEPSVEMIIGILGIWKTGGAYLPIDPYSPLERIDYMLKDSGVKLLVTTNDKEGEKVRRWEGEKVLFEEIFKSPKNPSYPLNFLPSYLLNPSNLVYIIYTSGTTGRPKGVLVEHRNVTAYLYAFFKEFDITTADTSIQLASFAFDTFIEEVFPVLLKGGKLVIPSSSEMMDIHTLAGLIQKHHVNIIDCTPLLLNEFDKLGIFTPGNCNLDYIFISGGDVLKKEYVANLLKVGKVYNTYGPTESTVCAAYYHYTGGDLNSIPIGKPISNYRIYILDKYLNLVPVLAAGELCVSGPGIVRGYLNNPGLTSEKFNRSYRSYKTDIFYKSGDLARRLPDGNVEFLGRIDQQVKIRGFRIELGEIESEIAKFRLVKEVIVIDREGETGEKYLCGYIVPGEKFELPVLKEYLAKSLPAYMIPSYFIEIESIPLSPNGKCDRRALPEPRITLLAENYTAPRNEIEDKIAVIWSEVLGIEKSKISIDADFFNLGGHSLKVMVMLAKIHKTFNLKLQLIQVFKAPTIKGIASLIEVLDWVNTDNTEESAGNFDAGDEGEEVIL